MTEKSELVQELHDKATRDAFVSSQMSIPLAFQILALREQRGMTQKQLAEKAGMLQPRIAAMERPSGSEPNLRTLKRLASAFDVALVVRFVPFSELVEWAETFSPDTFVVQSFDDDPGFHEREAASTQKVEIVMDEGASIRGRLQEQNDRYNLLSSQVSINDATKQCTPVLNYDQAVVRFQVERATDPGLLPDQPRRIAGNEREKKAS